MAGHYYTRDGAPMHFVPKAKGGGTRPTTIADARKLRLLPSVTTVLDVLAKPGLQKWLIRTAVEAVMTAPRNEGEELDAFIERVLETERQQDEESKKARELGTNIHAQLELRLKGEQFDGFYAPFIEPAVEDMLQRGTVDATEKVLCGEGYAGRTDLLLGHYNVGLTVVDFKTTKTLPTKSSWPEHRLQLAAYAKACGAVATANCYISTTETGKFVWFDNDDWEGDYERGFLPALQCWMWMNHYDPREQDLDDLPEGLL